jgi:hypothetical protein
MQLDNSLAMVHEEDRERVHHAVTASIARHTEYQCSKNAIRS